MIKNNRNRSYNSMKIMLFIIFKYSVFCVIANEDESKEIIYILVWANLYISRLWLLMTPGQQYFVNNKCRYQNCFLTSNRSYFHNVKYFDVLLFHAGNLQDTELEVPADRWDSQLYIFMCDEPPYMNPVPRRYNGFFNLTWTFKFNSDIFFKYITVKDEKGKVIGPKANMHWMDFSDMKPTSKQIKLKLNMKSKAAAWFVSHCDTEGQREVLVRELIVELQKYGLIVEVYGICGDPLWKPLSCGYKHKECDDLIQSDYYFYLAFENSMAEDYVTEKVLTATRNLAVPIVYGGGTYTR